MMPPKYSLAEIERRWLVLPHLLPALENLPYRIVEDCYIAGTRLRLRKLSGPAGETVYKLCKKYRRGPSLARPITNIYLSEDEYRIFSNLTGTRVCKRRYEIAGGSIDIYASGAQLAIFEMEFAAEDEAMVYVPPAFAGKEVTEDALYSGAALAARAAT